MQHPGPLPIETLEGIHLYIPQVSLGWFSTCRLLTLLLSCFARDFLVEARVRQGDGYELLEYPRKREREHVSPSDLE